MSVDFRPDKAQAFNEHIDHKSAGRKIHNPLKVAVHKLWQKINLLDLKKKNTKYIESVTGYIDCGQLWIF